MMKKHRRFLQGWRACEQHLQDKIRTQLAAEVRSIIEGHHLSYSDDKALKFFTEKIDDQITDEEKRV